jgi:hypothetical protein
MSSFWVNFHEKFPIITILWGLNLPQGTELLLWYGLLVVSVCICSFTHCSLVELVNISMVVADAEAQSLVIQLHKIIWPEPQESELERTKMIVNPIFVTLLVD